MTECPECRANSENGKSVATVTWKLLPFDDDDEEERWERTASVKEAAAGGENG